MFNNFINRYDLVTLLRLFRRGPARIMGLFGRLFGSSKKKVAKTWQVTQRNPRHWWSIPAVKRRWNMMITGEETGEPKRWFLDKYFSGRTDLIALSIGCGSGTQELAWAKTGAIKRLDAFDLSPQRIEAAKKKAIEGGLEGIMNFYVAEGMEHVESGAYDLFIGEQSIHHFSELDRLFREIKRVLRPGGLVYLNEFIGPTRLQWTDDQVSVAQETLMKLPLQYRKRFDGRGYKNSIDRPSKLRMMMVDPSEAIESDRIMPSLKAEFELLEERPYGGAVLHLLFHDIAHHFMDETEETPDLLQMCFAAEDEAMADGRVGSDFVIAIARPK